MNPTTTDKDPNLLAEFENAGYDHLTRFFDRWKGRVYFSDMAKARMGCILGYILGFKHAGEPAFAEKLAEDIEAKLRFLSPPGNDREISTADNSRVVKVPQRKCILADDGTWHGFSLLWFNLIDPGTYKGHLQLAQAELDVESETGEVFETAHQRVVKKLNIRERLDDHNKYSEELTEYRYIDGEHRKFYYMVSHNGGLIYHGPGGGQTFTVTLDKTPLWGIHT